MGAKNQTSRPRPIREAQKQPPTEPAKSPSLKQLWPKNIDLKNTNTKIIIAIVLLVVAVLFIHNYKQTRDKLALNDGTKLSAQIGKFLELPANETPTLATVKDANKLKAQPFFKHARDGDKVLIYSQTGRAVLYRPSTKKVIEYSPISLGGSTPAAQ